MVRDMETFYPRKDEMGNGPIELVLGNVLDKVSERHRTCMAWKALCCVAVATSTTTMTTTTTKIQLSTHEQELRRSGKTQRHQS